MTSTDVPRSMTATASAREYAELAGLVRQAGLHRRRYHYYAVRITLNLLVFAAGWVGFVLLGDSWWQLLLAAFFAVMYAQLAFVGHDAGHGQVFTSRAANDVLGIAHGALVGMSYGRWVDQHNRHHSHPNHELRDPDVDITVLAFTADQAATKRGLVRWTSAHQAALFFPFLLLEGFSLHVSSVRVLLRGGTRARTVELPLLAAHVVVYLAAVFLVLSPLTAVVFVVVHQCLWGFYMGCAFAPGHKGMPTVTGDDELGFFRRQILTTRNISGGRVVDVVLGGLNHQIEHHLFPTMARPNLRHARPIVREFCARNAIEYAECGWLRTYVDVVEHLHAVSAPLRAAAR